jgi:hypothetical protein
MLDSARRADSVQANQKERDRKLARALEAQGSQVIWKSFYREREHPVCMEVFYHSGKLPLSGGGSLFTWIEYNWKDSYPGLEPAQIAERVYGKAVSTLDLALVFADPAAADDPNKVDNAFGREVARYIATKLPNDRRWERAFELDDPHWGRVVAYRNKSADRHSYLRSLETDLGINPKPARD